MPTQGPIPQHPSQSQPLRLPPVQDRLDEVGREASGTRSWLCLWDKIRALELLGRHLGLFAGQLEVTGRNGEPLLPELTEDELIAGLKAKRGTSGA